MKTLRNLLFVVLALACLPSCTNWAVRSECGQVNWYDHGYQAAMSGRRLSGDPHVDRCRNAGFDLPEQQLDHGFKAGMANYCKPEIVFTTGKEGQFFNTDLCDPGQAPLLKQRHADGVRAYCARTNGFHAGTSGKKYQNICPPELEAAFLPEYKRGRQRYLSNLIAQAQREDLQTERKILDGERQRATLTTRLALLPRPRDVKERVYNSATGSYTEQSKTEDPAARERQRLNSELTSLDAQIRTEKKRQEQLRQEISQHERELITLDEGSTGRDKSR